MKILLLSDYYPPDKVGGVGVIAAELKSAYEELGHEVFVLTTGRQRESESRSKIERSSTSLLVGILLNNWRALRLIARENVSFVHMHQASSTVFLLARGVFKTFPFVLNSLQVSYLSEAAEISPYQVEDHSFWPRFGEYLQKYVWSPIHVAVDWIGYKLSDHATVVSEQNREEMLSSFGRSGAGEAPEVIPNGVLRASSNHSEREGFRDAGLEERLEGKTVLAYVGVFRIRKRVQNLILALRKVVSNDPEVVLLIVGGGRGYRSSLESLTHELGLDEHVIFVGNVPHETVPYYLELTDIFCLLSSYEGMPMALLEAMDAGKAVVTTNCYGMRDLLSDEECGVLVPVDDISATADALNELVASPERRLKLGNAARQRVRECYKWEDLARSYLDLMEASPGRNG